MNARLNEILAKIRELEFKVQAEMRVREADLRFKVAEGRVIFDREVLVLHKMLASSLFSYIVSAPLLTILSAPMVYAMVFPAMLLDLTLWIYQSVCFPIYGIQKVRRADHIILDRHYLKYLNVLERLNCDYCSYFNGLASYMMEIGSRTEQYWCPVKHASGSARRNSGAHLFADFGDADSYRTKLEKIREELNDIALK